MVGVGIIHFLGSHVIKAFGAEKVSPAGAVEALGQPDGAAQLRMGIKCREDVISGSSLRVKAGGDGDGLQKGGFAASVFAHKESDGFGEVQGIKAAERLNPPDIAGTADLVPLDGHILDEEIIHSSFAPPARIL